MSRIDEALRKSGSAPLPAPREPVADPLAAFGVDDEEPAAPDPPPSLARATGPPERVLEGGRTSGGDTPTGKLVIEQNVGAQTVEQFRRLGAILHDVHANGVKVVMIASAQVGDGKTLTAANLALTLGESYRQRVLLIDADLRRPSLVPLFGIPHVAGLSEGLRAEGDRPIAVVDLSEYVVLLPGGAPDPDPMASLTSERMRRIVEEAKKEFDWVIIDTPPITVLPDAHLLARIADASVLVIAAGKTQHPNVMKAIETLGRDRIIGVVLNRVDEGSAPASDYYPFGPLGIPAGRSPRLSDGAPV
jgi:capsular exopolysaccharide synthesis family protein